MAPQLDALPRGGPMRMQLDYLRAWLALSSRGVLELCGGEGPAASEGAAAALSGLRAAADAAESYAADELLDLVSGRRGVSSMGWSEFAWKGRCQVASTAAPAAQPPPTSSVQALCVTHYLHA